MMAVLIALSLAACRTSSSFVLPTSAPTAQPLATPEPMPSLALSSRGSPPATYTVPANALLVAGRPTLAPAVQTATALARRPPPTATPTATLAPVRQTASEAAAPWRSQPPQQIDCLDGGTVFRANFPSPGGQGRYHAYLPPCYQRDGRAYPVLYLLHGSIQTDTHWLNLGLATVMDRALAQGRFPPFIVIMPFNERLGNITSGGPSSVEGMLVDYLLPYVDAHFCTWASPAGRSIGGISRGGYWALEVAFRHPDKFGAVAGHSSHLRFETDSARYNPLATYATADLSAMRIWLDRGETDFLRAGQDQLHALLDEAGRPHVYQVNPGGHNDAYWASHLPAYLDWHSAGWSADRKAYPACPDT